VQAVAEELRMGVEVHSCELLEEGSRLFGPKSKAFPDPEQRFRARERAKAHGVLLEKNWPLGYVDAYVQEGKRGERPIHGLVG
jgi:hypothetical protein